MKAKSNNKINKALVMKWAWKLYRKQKGNTDKQFSDCLKYAWSVIKPYTANNEFEKLYKRYYGGLFNYLRLKVYDVNDVEELINDTFVKLNENYILFDAKIGNVGSWIYGISDNAVIDLYRRNDKYSANVSMSEMTDDNGKEVMQIADDFATDELAERNEREERIKTIFEKVLTEKQRKVAELHFILDYSYEQVKEALQISMADVKATIRRARIALQNESTLEGIYREVCR